MDKIGICTYCNQKKKLKQYLMSTSGKKICKDLCDQCADRLGREFELDCINDYSGITETAVSVKSTSSVFCFLSILIALCGFVGGIFLGWKYPSVDIQSIFQNGTKGTFNFTLMICVWLGTLILFFIFWGICRILENQEKILRSGNQ